MRRWTLALALMLLAGCGDSTGAVCTRENVDAACTAYTEATLDPETNQWRVILRTTMTDVIEYEDNGHLCVQTNRRCVEEECHFYQVDSEGRPMPYESAAEAIAACAELYARQ